MTEQTTFHFGTRSMMRLVGVDDSLVRVAKLAISKSPFDFTVVEGKRTLQRQTELYAQGRTKPGKVVTWTMKSKHLDGKAIDLAPCDANGRIDWTDIDKFKKIASLMFWAAEELNVKIRWGGDWNQNGRPHEKGETDSPHFELVD